MNLGTPVLLFGTEEVKSRCWFRLRCSRCLTLIFCPQMIPFAGTILGGLLPGEMVLIQGSVPSDADR